MSPSVRRARTADVRTALVDAAVVVVERDGFAGLTVRAVAHEAGVAPMGVYNHLQDKDGLLVAVLARGFDRLTEATHWRAELPPAEAFREVGLAYRRFALSAPVTYGLMFGGGTPVDVHARLAEHADPAFQGLLAVVRAAQTGGVVRAGEPQLLAMAIWSSVHGAISLELVSATPPEDGQAVYAGVLEMIERGLAPV